MIDIIDWNDSEKSEHVSLWLYKVGHLTFGIWIGYKKTLWIFFQKYAFIRKIEPSHLRMKHNIIQMTAAATFTVPHSINPIFQYIFDCLGKRSISKNVAFGAQKIQTWSLRSWCTHNEWLFGADFGPVVSLGHFSSKMSKEPLLRSPKFWCQLAATELWFDPVGLFFVGSR